MKDMLGEYKHLPRRRTAPVARSLPYCHERSGRMFSLAQFPCGLGEMTGPFKRLGAKGAYKGSCRLVARNAQARYMAELKLHDHRGGCRGRQRHLHQEIAARRSHTSAHGLSPNGTPRAFALQHGTPALPITCSARLPCTGGMVP